MSILIPKKTQITKLVERFLKPEKIESDAKFWAAQSKIFNKLKKEYPDELFWSSLSIGFKINHMAFFLTPNGKDILEKKYNFFVLNSSKQKIEENVIEQDVEVQYNKEVVNRPKSILDFI